MSKNSDVENNISKIFSQPIGSPLHRDCFTYAVVIGEELGGSSIFCAYVPEKQDLDSLHACAVINGGLYDFRAERLSKNDIIGEQMYIMRRKHEKYILENEINNRVVQHLNEESEELSLKMAKKNELFDRDLYRRIKSNCL